VVEKCKCRYLGVISFSFFTLFFPYINSFIFSINLFPKVFAWLLIYGGGTCGASINLFRKRMGGWGLKDV